MKIFLCCSKYFYERLFPIIENLKRMGHEVTLPNSYDSPSEEIKMKMVGKEEHIKWKSEMLRKDEPNIKPQDAIFVLNFEKNGISNYIGGATFLEIYVAWKLNKKIFFYNPIPKCSFSDELVAMEPNIINGDLSFIK